MATSPVRPASFSRGVMSYARVEALPILKTLIWSNAAAFASLHVRKQVWWTRSFVKADHCVEVDVGSVAFASHAVACQCHACMFARFLLLTTALLAAPALTFAQAPTCPQFFAGEQPPALLNPKLGQRTTLLCNDAYAVLASGVTRGALWSAEHPTTASLDAARETPREGQFHVEDRLPPSDQARLEDYRRSGFDRGHMTPSGDMPDAQSQQQTFSLANMVPQAAELNRGVWAGIEMAVRHLAQRRGELFIVTGPAFQGQALKTIGSNGVLVPSATWKAVYDPRSGGAGA